MIFRNNLSRSLFFTTQLLELGIPVVIALNKSDINEIVAEQPDATFIPYLETLQKDLELRA